MHPPSPPSKLSFKKKEGKRKETPVIKESSSPAEEGGLAGTQHLSSQEPAARRTGNLLLGLKTGTGFLPGHAHPEFFSGKGRAQFSITFKTP